MTAATAEADLPAPRTFADIGVDERICAALADMGITTPFPIQEMTLPLGLSGADLIGQARTGTGKTLAFGIPLLQRIDASKKETQALVVVPTRELCLQVRDDIERAGDRTGARVVALYGGKAIDPQASELEKGAPVVVGTPGRLLDLRRRGALALGRVTTLVLDEADEMLDLGFLPDVEQIIQATDSGRQTLLFSATMPSAVVALARRYMRKPTFMRADVEESRVAPETRQYFFACHPMDKPAVLARILQAPGRGLCVAFTRTKRMADTLAADLRDRDIAAAPIHSDLRQEARERTLTRFRAGKIDVLVATEVAARGLDITDVTHVINYDCPDDEKMYLHRIGRTGRAGAAGAAITLAVWHEQTRLDVIKKALGISEPTHEVFSTSPILHELFDLPAQPEHPRVPSTPSREVGQRRPRGDRRRDEDRPAPRGTAEGAGGAEARDRDTRRVRRRSRRGGGRGADPAGAPAPAAAEPAGETSAATAPRRSGQPADRPDGTRGDGADRPSDADAEARAGGRTRRRTKRSRTAGGDSGEAGAAASPETAGPPDDGGRADTEHGSTRDRDADAAGRRRSRRRAVTGAGSRTGADPGDGGRTGADPGDGGRTGQADRDGKRSGGRDDGRPDQRRGSGRRQRRGGRRPAAAAEPAAAAPHAVGDSGILRGTGQPRLSRPLSISHLP